MPDSRLVLFKARAIRALENTMAWLVEIFYGNVRLLAAITGILKKISIELARDRSHLRECWFPLILQSGDGPIDCQLRRGLKFARLKIFDLVADRPQMISRLQDIFNLF